MTARKATPDEIRRIQRALMERGLYASAIDGIAGTGTKEAIRLWQEDAGHEVTGVLTTAQLIELGAFPAPPKRSNPISDFITNLVAQKGAEFILNQLKGSIAMDFLIKSKTAITGVVMIFVGAASLVAPIVGLGDIPGLDVLTAGEAWMSVTGGFGLIFLRAAVAKS